MRFSNIWNAIKRLAGRGGKSEDQVEVPSWQTGTGRYNMQTLQLLLRSNVVQANFIRRHEKLGWSVSRGAFITTNFELLNGDLGYKTLNFKPPNGRGMGYDHRKYNLVVGWDIFRQEYRVFGVENSRISKYFDVTSEESRAAFWVYFRDYIMTLSPQQKLIYMGYMGN